MIIKIDIDEVLRDTSSKMIELYNNEFNENLTKKQFTKWDVSLIFSKLGTSAKDWFFKQHAKEIFLESNLIENADIAIKKLIVNNQIILVSNQLNFDSKVATLQWLHNYDIQYHDIAFVANKSLIKGDLLIDDAPHNILNKFDYSKKIMINMPYNKDVFHKSLLGKVDSLYESVDIITAYTKKR